MLQRTDPAPTTQRQDSQQVRFLAVGANETTGDGKTYFYVPEKWDGARVRRVRAQNDVAGITGTGLVQLRNVTQGSDILSTGCTITGVGVTGADGVVNPATNRLAKNDQLAVDIDTIHSGTAAIGGVLIVEVDL